MNNIVHATIICKDCQRVLFEMEGNQAAITTVIPTVAGFVGLQHAPEHCIYPHFKANIDINFAPVAQILTPNSPIASH